MSSQDDEVISLEDLVKDEGLQVATTIAGAPVPVEGRSRSQKGDEEAPAETKAAENPEITAAFTPDLSELERVLSVEDPDFSKSLSDFKEAEPPPADIEIDSLDLSEALREANLKGWKKVFFILIRRPIRAIKGQAFSIKGVFKNFRGSVSWLLKSAVLGVATGSKKAAIASLAGVKSSVTSLVNLPGTSKAMVAVVIGLGVALYFVLKTTLHGHLLPELQPPFLRSIESIAESRYEYDPHEPLEDFNNPLLHPENVVQLDKVVVNLKSADENSNPMGMFELYVETATHEAAVELKDREIEARDVVARTMEQMPYDELITLEGKEKLKNIVRTNLNTFLTQGRVRKVFFKTMVLKP